MKGNLIKTIARTNLFLLVCQIFIIFAVWQFLPPEIPLFYSRPWGKDQLVPFPAILILPVTGLIVFFANLVIARLAAKEETLVKQMLSISSFVFSFLIMIALIQIIRLIL